MASVKSLSGNFESAVRDLGGSENGGNLNLKGAPNKEWATTLEDSETHFNILHGENSLGY